jgi:tRNA-2-methylthio-N6-dimethylallyladenosine synthase
MIKNGFLPENNIYDADIIIYNTCAIRQRAEEKVFGNIGSLKTLKNKKPDLIFAIVGCMAKKEENILFQKIPHLDIAAGPQAVFKIPDMIKAVLKGKSVQNDFQEYGYIPEGECIKREGKISAWISIMKGCDNFCAYCIVPYVRGREKSRPSKEIINEIKGVVKDGFSEITLLGQNVLAYGKKLDEIIDFSDLIKKIHSIKGLERIRYETGHPRDYTEKLLDTFDEFPKLCKHFHLPLQAGSNKILKAMNRGHSKEFFIDLVSRIKKRFPYSSVTSDIIVGFPGESDLDFEETIDVVKKVRFDGAHTFYFSPREGTKAWNLRPLLPENERKKRLAKLNLLQNRICYEENQKYLNQTVNVLCEGLDKKHNKFITGRTDTNKIAIINPETELLKHSYGSIINAKVIETTAWTLKCEFTGFIKLGCNNEKE